MDWRAEFIEGVIVAVEQWQPKRWWRKLLKSMVLNALIKERQERHNGTA